jgi:DNA polymerase-3 subunit delta'
MTFSSIPGQEKLKALIRDLSSGGRLPHALLLLGKYGYGMWPMAWAIARWIFCSDRSQIDACGVCTNCKKLDQLQHPDFHFFFPTSQAGVKASDKIDVFRAASMQNPYFDGSYFIEALEEKNKTLNINKDTVREIINSFDFKSYQQGSSVYVIWGADYLGKEGNRLLKLIEEPPNDSYIILLAERREHILPTILSRCQSTLMQPVPAEAMTQHLINTTKDYSAEQISGAVSIADGDVNIAMDMLLDSKQSISGLWINWMRNCYRNNPAIFMIDAHKIAAGGKEQMRKFIRFGLDFASEMIRSKSGLNSEKYPEAIKLAALFSHKQIFEFTERLSQEYQHIMRNANSKIVMGSLSIYLSSLFEDYRKKKYRV